MRFPGAPPDTYYIRVTHVIEGRVAHKPLKLTVETKVTQITTTKSSIGTNRQGSLLGGQFVTIDGSNFSPSTQQNIVKLENVDCIVKEASKEQLVC